MLACVQGLLTNTCASLRLYFTDHLVAGSIVHHSDNIVSRSKAKLFVFIEAKTMREYEERLPFNNMYRLWHCVRVNRLTRALFSVASRSASSVRRWSIMFNASSSTTITMRPLEGRACSLLKRFQLKIYTFFPSHHAAISPCTTMLRPALSFHNS